MTLRWKVILGAVLLLSIAAFFSPHRWDFGRLQKIPCVHP